MTPGECGTCFNYRIAPSTHTDQTWDFDAGFSKYEIAPIMEGIKTTLCFSSMFRYNFQGGQRSNAATELWMLMWEFFFVSIHLRFELLWFRLEQEHTDCTTILPEDMNCSKCCLIFIGHERSSPVNTDWKTSQNTVLHLISLKNLTKTVHWEQFAKTWTLFVMSGEEPKIWFWWLVIHFDQIARPWTLQLHWQIGKTAAHAKKLYFPFPH